MAKSSGGSCKKVDRQRKSPGNLRYIGEHRHDKSHIRKIKRHLSRVGHDACAERALEKYQKAAFGARGASS